MLSEVATGKRGGKVVALVDVRRAYFYAPPRRRVFVELPPEDFQAGDEHMCGLLQYSFYGTRDAAQNWQEELASTLSDLKLTKGIACPCVWQGCIKGKHRGNRARGRRQQNTVCLSGRFGCNLGRALEDPNQDKSEQGAASGSRWTGASSSSQHGTLGWWGESWSADKNWLSWTNSPNSRWTSQGRSAESARGRKIISRH